MIDRCSPRNWRTVQFDWAQVSTVRRAASVQKQSKSLLEQLGRSRHSSYTPLRVSIVFLAIHDRHLYLTAHSGSSDCKSWLVYTVLRPAFPVDEAAIEIKWRAEMTRSRSLIVELKLARAHQESRTVHHISSCVLTRLWHCRASAQIWRSGLRFRWLLFHEVFAKRDRPLTALCA